MTDAPFPETHRATLRRINSWVIDKAAHEAIDAALKQIEQLTWHNNLLTLERDRLKRLESLVADLKAHWREAGYQDADDPIVRLLEWETP
jgi:hypothetical protein